VSCHKKFSRVATETPASARGTIAFPSGAKAALMPAQTILWVDLRSEGSEPDLCSSLPPVYKTQRLRHLPGLLRAVQHSRPWAVCVEYDTLDAHGVSTILAVRRRHATLPIILLSEDSRTAEDPAFRKCAWDSLVKPVSVARLCDSLTSLERTRAVNAISPAVSYVATNYSQKVSLSRAAKLCDLSRFQLSRFFKKEHGLTFRDFVVRLRIERAAELMRRSPALSVTDAAFIVGFNDVSHFSRMFRRQLGVLPSHYRHTDGEPVQLHLFQINGARQG
jgi:AraC-like DNA-binding protein